MNDKEENGHPTYLFMQMNNKYTIPGSSLRGPVRTMYETLTDSCMSTLPDNYLLTERVQTWKPFAPALLIKENGEWQLYRAERKKIREKATNNSAGERIINKSGKIYHYGDAVYAINQSGGNFNISVDDIISSPDKNHPEPIGFFFIGEAIRNKKYESAFIKSNQLTSVTPDQIRHAIDGLRITLQIYRDVAVNKQLNEHPDKTDPTHKKIHYGYQAFERACSNGAVPVWYRIESGFLYLSMAAIGRRAFFNSVNDLAGAACKPCADREKACSACSLFGMAKNESLSGRVRFSDAEMVKGIKIDSVLLKELGSPRPGYLPFYSLNGNSYDEQGASIAGRKIYWHNPEAEKSDVPYKDTSNKGETDRNATMDLIKDAEFTFDVYFDQITSDELEELEWTLVLGENREDSNYCYKIGHGKPLGLGSVKITIDRVYTRSFSPDSAYVVQTEAVTQKSFDNYPRQFSQEAVNQIKCATDFYYIEDKICYPYVEPTGRVMDAWKRTKPEDENAFASHQ